MGIMEEGWNGNSIKAIQPHIESYLYLKGLNFLVLRASFNITTCALTQYLIHKHRIPHWASGIRSLYSEPWDPFVISHSISISSFWAQRLLEWVSKGTTDVPTRNKIIWNSELTSFPRSSIHLTTSLNGQLGDISYQVPITLGSKELEFLVHEVETLLPKDAATLAWNRNYGCLQSLWAAHD